MTAPTPTLAGSTPDRKASNTPEFNTEKNPEHEQLMWGFVLQIQLNDNVLHPAMSERVK